MITNHLRRALLGAALMVAGVASATAAADGLGSPATAGDVTVTVKYTGKGTVDATHKIWVWLFTSPEIGPGAIPIAEMTIEKNGDAAAFVNIGADKVWIAIAYDEAGGFAGQAPPPTGSPITLYSADGKGPTAVTPGSQGNVSVSFNDSQRMQ